MTAKECYEKLQGDYIGASKRLISEKMLTLFINKFPNDTSMKALLDAVEARDIETSFRSVHTLKGVSANLGFTELYKAAWNLTEQLRPRQEQADKNLLKILEDEYNRTIAILKEFAETN